MLQEKGWITEEQYERAIILSARYGETPGYHLVNDGAIADEDLVDFFIRHFSIRYCPKHQLKQVTEEALSLVPHSHAKHLRVFPVSVSSTTMVLGLTDPSLTHAVEEISYHTQRHVEPVIVSETDMTWALATYYHIHPNTPAERYSIKPSNEVRTGVEKDNPAKVVASVRISEAGWGIDEWELEESRGQSRTSDTALPIATPRNSPEAQKHQQSAQKKSIPLVSMPSFRPTLPPPTSISPPKSPSIRHSIASMMQGLPEESDATESQTDGREEKSTTNDIKIPREIIYEYRNDNELPKQSIADIIDHIKTASSRDDIISGALDFLLLFSKRAAFFTTKKDEIRGFNIKGEHAHKEAIRRYWIPQSADSTFRRTMDDRQIHLGPLIRSTSDAVLAAALGGRPRRVIIIPVEIKTRVVGLLYADRLKIEMPPWYLLERLADVVGGALLRLILKNIKS